MEKGYEENRGADGLGWSKLKKKNKTPLSGVVLFFFRVVLESVGSASQWSRGVGFGDRRSLALACARP
tara:strand:- start:199103 stop:199306 length:204 start_codon:yes stop_codon:yes gene_type:complete